MRIRGVVVAPSPQRRILVRSRTPMFRTAPKSRRVLAEQGIDTMWAECRRKTTWIPAAVVGCGVALAGLLLTAELRSILSQWRERTVFQALVQSDDAAFWWPAGWRRELRTSILLVGQLRHARAGTIELVAEPQGHVFRTTVTN